MVVGSFIAVDSLFGFVLEGDASGDDSQIQSLFFYQTSGGLPAKVRILTNYLHGNATNACPFPFRNTTKKLQSSIYTLESLLPS
jgi:hypothetical protein